eukprot:scaffold73614_cov65-Cyclotella_meneghiniana.AAC.1
MKSLILFCAAVLFSPSHAFSAISQTRTAHKIASSRSNIRPARLLRTNKVIGTRLNALDLDTVALVTGQENYGLGIVVLGEAIWSFSQSPSFSNIKVVIPPAIAAVILFAVSGPMVTSGEASSVALGLEIATACSALLGANYVARMAAPFSESPKEIAFFGLLVAIAGFFSFSQNLVVDGFVQLPNVPSIPLPQIPLGLGEDIDTDRY